MAEKITTSDPIGIKRFQKFMRNLSHRQIPYATANALNRTAFSARTSVQNSMSNRFIIRKNFVVRGVLVKKATRQDLEI